VVRAKPVEKQGKALAYRRTSSAQNVGGDSDQRQREAIERFARSHGYELVGEFYDAAVSGADPIEGNGVRVVIVEDASRFARSVIAQELGVLAIQARGVHVLTSSGEDLTNTDDPAKVMMRQIAGAFAQYEKTRLVAKLKGAGTASRRSSASASRGGRATLRPGRSWCARRSGWPGRARRPVRRGRYARSPRSWRSWASSTARVSASQQRRWHG
jgi:DNA invertase Pin-like site-specific DNA recombinase